MFATEVTLHDKTRPTTTGSINRDQNPIISNGSLKVRMLKQKVKDLDKQYVRALSQVSKTRKSIDNNRKQSQQVKVNFLKLYENKKMKLFEKKLVEEKKILDHDNIQSSMKKVKQRKINSELQMLIMRSEEDQNKSRLREKYKKDKERIKSMISEKKSLEEEQGKRRFQKIKNQEMDLYGKKKKIEDMLLMRSRQNYLRKMQREMVIIESFDNLMNEVQQCTDVDWDQQFNSTESKSFFVTNNNIYE